MYQTNPLSLYTNKAWPHMTAQFGSAANGSGMAAGTLTYAAIGTGGGKGTLMFGALGNIQTVVTGGIEVDGDRISRQFAVGSLQLKN
jgi:hypothetical protein